MDPSKNQPQSESRLHFLDYWRIIRIRKTIIIAVFLLVALTATVVTFLLQPAYASTTRIRIEQNGGDIRGMADNTYLGNYDPYFIQTEFEVIQDQVVLGKVIDALNLNVEWGKKYHGGEPFKTSETMEFLKHRIALTPVRNTKLIEITVYSDDKDEAARIANAIADAYYNYRQEQLRKQTQGGIKALQESYAEEEALIQTLQSNVVQLRDQLNIHDTDPHSITPTPTFTTEELQHYQQLMIEGEARYTKLEKQLDQLKSVSLDKLRDVLPTVSPDNDLSGALTSLHQAEQKLATLKADFGPENPEVIRVQSLVDLVNTQIDNRVNGIMIGLQNQLQSEKAALDSLKSDLEAAKRKDQEEATRSQPYWDAKRKLESKLEFHKLLAAKIESEKVDEGIPKNIMVEITRRAEPSKDPVKPNKTLNIALGIIVGLIVGIGLAFFIEYLDTSVKTIDDVERALQAHVLGVIPQDVGYLIDEGAESQHAEAYRVLRTNILFSRKDEKFNSIVMVSAGAGEGKSTTTLNLATVFAQAGERILVVDSDLRRPTIHKILNIGNAIGLTNYLLKQNTLEEVIQTTKLPTLHVMPSGKLPSSSMGILNSTRMREMIADLKQRYDYVFFDSPPILGVSDASVLASEMDMVIQVIQYRRYPQPMNIRAKQLIEKVGGNLLGIVLNNINMSQDESYYYYSGYYHGYYYSTDQDEQKESQSGKPGEAPANSGESGGIKQKY